MHSFLATVRLSYQIFLIEPHKTNKFNRGLLANIGYLESLKKRNFNCFILHDVDLIPENMDNSYYCDQKYPLQMAISTSIYNYLLVIKYNDNKYSKQNTLILNFFKSDQ